MECHGSGGSAEQQSQKSAFVADACGRVQDVRGLDESQIAAALSAWEVRQQPPRLEPRYYVIFIPIGLIISLIVALVSLVTPESRAKREFSAGNDNYEVRSYEQAIARYDEAIRLKSDFWEAYNNRGLAQQAKGEYDRAIADFDQALKLNPVSAQTSEILDNRGLAYRAIGAYDEAIADFSEAIEQDSFALHPAYYDHRGVTYWYAEDYDKAIADFNAGIRAVVGHRLGLSLDPAPDEADTLDQRLDEQIADFTFKEELPLLYAHRGLAYLSIENADKALADLDRSIKLRPRLALGYYLRGVAYRLTGDGDRAVEDFRHVIALNNDPDLLRQAETQLRELGVTP